MLRPTLVVVLLALTGLPAAVSLPADDVDLRVNAPYVNGPSVVEAGVPATYYGQFRTGTPTASTVALDHAGETVWLEVDGVRTTSTVADRNGAFRFTVPLPRGMHELRAVVDEDPDSPAVSSGYHSVASAVPPSAPLSLAAGPAVHWDDVRLSWARPADDGGLSELTYRVSVSPAPRSPHYVSAERVDIRLWPDATYDLTVAACNAVGCGPAAAPVQYMLPPPVGVDEIRIDIWEIIVCSNDRAHCVGVEPGGRATVHGADFFAVAQVQGRALRNGEGAEIRFDGVGGMNGATGPAQEVTTRGRTTFGDMPELPHDVFTHPGDYHFSAELGEGVLAPNECRRLDIAVTATHLDDAWRAETGATVCRTR